MDMMLGYYITSIVKSTHFLFHSMRFGVTHIMPSVSCFYVFMLNNLEQLYHTGMYFYKEFKIKSKRLAKTVLYTVYLHNPLSHKSQSYKVKISHIS